jgi:DNA-binding XRE family transcriptional regulator
MKSTVGSSLEKLLSELTPEHRARIEARGKRLVAEVMTLRELRKARNLTQTKLAKKLRTTQNNISRIEQNSDLLLSTLRSYVEAAGGRINIVAEFPDLPPVVISGLHELGPARRGA